MYFDRFECTAEQISIDSFTFTLVQYSEAPPADEEFVCVLESNPQNEQSVRCTVKLSYLSATTGVLDICEVFETSETDNSLFFFSGSVFAFSSTTKGDKERQTKKRRAIAGIGEGNIISNNTGRDNRDFIYSNVPAWDAPNNYTELAAEPLPHQTLSPSGATTVSYLTSLANRMIDEGYKTVPIVPCGKVDAAFSDNEWNPGDPAYNEARARMSNWHNEDPDLNEIEVVIFRGCETDTAAGWTGTQVRDAAKAMAEQLRNDLTADTGFDYSRLPFVFVGMNDQYITNNANGPEVESGLADIPNVLTYSAYLSLQPWSTTNGRGGLADNFYDDSDTALRAGSKEIYPKIRDAKKNRNPGGVDLVTGDITSPLAGITNDAAGQVAVTGAIDTPLDGITNNIVGSLPGQAVGTISTDLEGITNAISGTVTTPPETGAINTPLEGMTNDIVGTIATGPSTPLTDALNPLHHFRSDFELVGNVSDEFVSWTNRGTGDDITNVTWGTPTIDGNGVNFDGSSSIELPLNGLVADADGMSFVIKYLSDDSGQLFSTGNTFINPVTDVCHCQNPLFGANDLTSNTALGDSVEHVFAMTLNTSGTYDLWLDGSNVGTRSAGPADVDDVLGTLGAVNNNTFGIIGYIKAVVAKPGVKWTLTDINNIASEMPA